MNIYANEFGVEPNKNVALDICELLDCLKNYNGHNTVIFDKGTYYIDSNNIKQRREYITNTVGDREFEQDIMPHDNKFALNIDDIEDMVFDFCGSELIVKGPMSNMIVKKCKNVVIKNLAIDVYEPRFRKLTVVKKSTFYIDFECDGRFIINQNHGLFLMNYEWNDYCASDKLKNASHIGMVKAKSPDIIKRTYKLFHNVLSWKKINNTTFRFYYPYTGFCDVGDKFYIFDSRRENVGIFVNQSENITFENVSQHFNYSLAFVAQDSKDITVRNCRFAPKKNSGRDVASLADFMQICMCRGNILIENNYFEGACDDCINIHGINYIIESIKGNKIMLLYKHPQTHGFNPISVGDKVAFVKPSSLKDQGTATVINSNLVREYHLEITVDSTEGAKEGYAVEDLTKIPQTIFRNNTVKRIITRGVLVTAREKTVIENNHFISCSMSGVLISDDASSWYESGCCKDVLIKDNVFDYCGKVPILIKPENKIDEGAVHSNIRIINNKFNYKGNPVKIKSAENIVIK